MSKPFRWRSGAAAVIAGGVVVCSCATQPRARRHANTGAHKQFNALDTTKDGKLGYDEFLKAPMARKSSDPRALFERIDTNHDGYITIPEWREYRLKTKKSG